MTCGQARRRFKFSSTRRSAMRFVAEGWSNAWEQRLGTETSQRGKRAKSPEKSAHVSYLPALRPCYSITFCVRLTRLLTCIAF